jgi:hypothetical protein
MSIMQPVRLDHSIRASALEYQVLMSRNGAPMG